MKRLLLAVTVCGMLAACGTIYPPPPPPPPSGGPAPDFRASDFSWSTQRGSAAISGKVDYAPNGARYSCANQPVILTPDAPYSRWRMDQQYGSAERAALTVAEVRGRQLSRPSDEYSAFVRRTTCDGAGQFAFQGLPAGSWFIVAVVQPQVAGAEPVALMRRVETRRAGARNVLMQ